MRSLFFKILVWFWLSNALIITLTVSYLTITRDARERESREAIRRRGRSSLGAALDLTAQNAAFLYETEGRKSLAEFVAQTQEVTGLTLWLYRVRGAEMSELTGQTVPPNAKKSALKVLESEDIERLVEDDFVYTARPAISYNGEAYIIVSKGRDYFRNLPGTSGPRPQDSLLQNIWGALSPTAGPQGFIFLGGAGVVCYALALYFSSPVRKLRRATNLLAEGDLSVRVGPQMGRRRDELADLGRDFDKMAERLQTLMVSEKRLLGDISHELRSPLARMNVALELAEQTANDDTQKYLQRIHRESGRLNELIGQLLALARLESGDTKDRGELVNLRELIEDVARDADFEAKSKNCGVVVRHNEDAQTQGNMELLRSAIENVVRNAIRYTGEKTEVEIEQRVQNGETLIRVRDYGEGVPEEALPELFRPFYRVASSRDRQSGGVGLGLAIAERAVRAHGGTIRAQNAPGGGLLVEFRLPLKRPAPAS